MQHAAKIAAQQERRASRLSQRLDELEEMAPSETLVAALRLLQSGFVDAPNAVRIRALWERVTSWSQAQSMISTADALNGIGYLPGLDAHEQGQIICQELAAALQVSVGTANNEIWMVDQISRVMDQTWMALSRGQLSMSHVRALVMATASTPPAVTRSVDEQIVPRAIASRWTPAQIKKYATRLILLIDPEGAAERAAAAKRDADVRFRPEPDETATMTAYGDGPRLRDVMDAINDRAEAMGREGDVRPVGQRRFAALGEAVLGEVADIATALDDDGEPTARTPSTTPRQRRAWRSHRRDALVHIDLATLLRLNDNPGELEGYGPITAETARRIAGESSLRRLVTDPLTGATIDLGMTRYAPTQQLRDFVQARDGVCVFPGCNRPARECEVDHRVEHDVEGPTDRANLQELCGFHHDLKTKKLWHVDHHGDGSLTWESAFGFRYTRHPDSFPVDRPPPAESHIPVDLPEGLLDGDPDPGRIDDPLPEAPPISIEEFYDYLDEVGRETYAYANSADYDDIIAMRSFAVPTRSTS